MRAAIYARFSTPDKCQDVENELARLRQYAQAQNWTIELYIDHESGTHANRESFGRLFRDASMRKIDVVLVWALDGFTREGVGPTFAHISKLTSLGVKFESLTEPHFRTTGPAGAVMIAIAAWIAKQEKQERLQISERSKAGMARVRAQGIHCGRPRALVQRDLVIELRNQGLSWRMIARKLGKPPSTLRRVLIREAA